MFELLGTGWLVPFGAAASLILALTLLALHVRDTNPTLYVGPLKFWGELVPRRIYAFLYSATMVVTALIFDLARFGR